tara:strand:+ start:3133 stop:3450 length:318 start_codon:yes stop_codon:yes gene_type:complete
MRSDDVIDTNWMEDAACRGKPVDLFFFDERKDRERLRMAKFVCSACTVTKECLNYAIETPIDFGIWGGLTSRERERMRWRERQKVLRARGRTGSVRGEAHEAPPE